MERKGKTIQIVLDGSSSSESESEHEDDGKVSPPFQIGTAVCQSVCLSVCLFISL